MTYGCLVPALKDDMVVDTLRPRQKGCHLATWYFLINANFTEISWQGSHYKSDPTLVHIMAWQRWGDNSLSEPIMALHICVTRPRWVKYSTSQELYIYMYMYMATVLSCFGIGRFNLVHVNGNWRTKVIWRYESAMNWWYMTTTTQTAANQNKTMRTFCWKYFIKMLNMIAMVSNGTLLIATDKTTIKYVDKEIVLRSYCGISCLTGYPLSSCQLRQWWLLRNLTSKLMTTRPAKMLCTFPISGLVFPMLWKAYFGPRSSFCLVVFVHINTFKPRQQDRHFP